MAIIVSVHRGLSSRAQQQRKSTYAEHVLDALGDPTRRRISRASGRAPARLESSLKEWAQAAVSQHLKVRNAARLVTDRAEGTRRLYAVDSRGFQAVRSWLDGFWNEALDAFEEMAEREAARERKRR